MGVNLLHSIEYFATNGFRPAQVRLHGCYKLKSSEEYPCHTLEISPGEALLHAPVKAAPGEKVDLYLKELGRFMGLAARTTETGFIMNLQLAPKSRKRLADQLTWFANRDARAVVDRRRHERIVPLMELTALRVAEGDAHIVRVTSLSLSGVAMEARFRPPLGAEVVIGNTAATVMRLFDDGFACEFVRHFRPGEIDETTRL